MSTTTIFHGDQFLEYFIEHVKSAKPTHVHIFTYTIQEYKKDGLIHDLLTELNREVYTVHILVGITRFIPITACKRNLKKYQKSYPRIAFRIVFNDHRKIFLTSTVTGVGSTLYRAWIGSQNLCESFTKNIVVECSESSIQFIKDEIKNVNFSKQPYDLNQ